MRVLQCGTERAGTHTRWSWAGEVGDRGVRRLAFDFGFRAEGLEKVALRLPCKPTLHRILLPRHHSQDLQ